MNTSESRGDASSPATPDHASEATTHSDAQTATDLAGMVHYLSGEATLCGQSATGWSRAVTSIQMAGLVLFCDDCQSANFAAKRFHAYRLGSIDAYAGRAMRDMGDADSAWLMDALGELAPTTAANWADRAAWCEAYFDGYQDAHSAIGGE